MAVLVDTSVAVALAVREHERHEAIRDSLADRTLGLAGHAFFETYSVLTRLPPPARRSIREVATLLDHNFPATRFLDEAAQASLRQELSANGIAGGAVYDALVGGAARHHGMLLLTRDTRAITVYRRLDVDVEMLE